MSTRWLDRLVSAERLTELLSVTLQAHGVAAWRVRRLVSDAEELLVVDHDLVAHARSRRQHRTACGAATARAGVRGGRDRATAQTPSARTEKVCGRCSTRVSDSQWVVMSWADAAVRALWNSILVDTVLHVDRHPVAEDATGGSDRVLHAAAKAFREAEKHSRYYGGAPLPSATAPDGLMKELLGRAAHVRADGGVMLRAETYAAHRLRDQQHQGHEVRAAARRVAAAPSIDAVAAEVARARRELGWRVAIGGPDCRTPGLNVVAAARGRAAAWPIPELVAAAEPDGVVVDSGGPVSHARAQRVAEAATVLVAQHGMSFQSDPVVELATATA